MDEYVTIAVHDEFAKRIEEQNARQNKRLELLEKSVDETRKLTISVEKMAISVENMASELGKQGQRLDAIEKEPADKWKQASNIILSILITAVITFALTQIGL